MSDLISRQAAIDALDEQIRQCDKALSAFDISMKDEYAVKVERASLVAFRETLEYMSSAQPGWIPCGTALPEHDGEYLVTKKSFGWNCKEYIESDIARYENKDGWHKADTVLAWMPLPTPYREGGQE